MSTTQSPLTLDQKIYRIRGQSVMLDRDLAQLYGVETRNLNKAVNRNKERFPEDFSFQLTENEEKNLMFQIGTSSLNGNYGGRRKPISAFTEQGVAMLSSVLRSKRAIEVNIQIMRAFVQLRQWMLTHKEVGERLRKLERQSMNQGADIRVIFETIRKMMLPPKTPPIISKPTIGFKPD